VVGGYTPSAYGLEVSARLVSVDDGSVLQAENALIPMDAAWMDQALGVMAFKLMSHWSKERGYVLDVFLEKERLPLLMIDLGTAQGAKVGRVVEVTTAGDPIIHPVTHENLGTRDVRLALATIVSCKEQFSYARVSNRSGVTEGPVRLEAEGIDLGLRRLQVDGKAVEFTGQEKRIFMDAGTHLVELKVGQSLMSREVRISKLGADPKAIVFKPEDLATAVTIKPPEPATAAAGETTVAKTDPSVTKEDRQKDDRLMAMLPKPEEIDRQLREARDQQVVAVFEAGLRSLRLGYARGNRSYLSIAASRFAEATRLAPDMALGYFNLGLARFYLDQYDDAKIAFDQAAKLDGSLKEDVPLLWWEDFREMPEEGRITAWALPENWQVREVNPLFRTAA